MKVMNNYIGLIYLLKTYHITSTGRRNGFKQKSRIQKKNN